MFRLGLVLATVIAVVSPWSHALLPANNQNRIVCNGPAITTTTNLKGFFDNLLPNSDTAAQSKKQPIVKVPDDFVPPEPRPLALTRSADIFGFVTASVSFAARLGTGTFTLGWKIDSLFFRDDDVSKKYSLQLGPFSIRDSSSVLAVAPRPQQPLILYEYDASPYCKRVREMINLLDLTVEYRPCPGARQGAFSKELLERTGRQTVPYLIDPNTGMELFESNDQIEYMLETYGPPAETYDRKALWPITFEPFSLLTSTIAGIIRGMPGGSRQSNARPDNEQMEPLELWGYESSPFVRPVREKLCTLCLPHRMISCPRGSANRDKMIQKTGRFQVPFLVDPNTGIEMYEGPEIVKYLDQVYTAQ
eukprot:scaffold318_cov110-Cylindrotheca_fusiformis.AAC.4